LLVGAAHPDADPRGVFMAEKQPGKLAQGGPRLGANFLIHAAVVRRDVEFHHMKESGAEWRLQGALLQITQGIRGAPAQVQRY
jgi:hypothetical protein